jgi:hypothetical protein
MVVAGCRPPQLCPAWDFRTQVPICAAGQDSVLLSGVVEALGLALLLLKGKKPVRIGARPGGVLCGGVPRQHSPYTTAFSAFDLGPMPGDWPATVLSARC